MMSPVNVMQYHITSRMYHVITYLVSLDVLVYFATRSLLYTYTMYTIHNMYCPLGGVIHYD